MLLKFLAKVRKTNIYSIRETTLSKLDALALGR